MGIYLAKTPNTHGYRFRSNHNTIWYKIVTLIAIDLENLEKRRQSLSLKFAKDCIKYEKFGNMFPLNDFSGKTQTRNMEKYKVPHTNTERMKKSPIPYMIDLLNKENNN